MKEKLSALYNEVQELQKVVNDKCKEYLAQAFNKRTEYVIPEWMREAVRQSGIECDLPHAWTEVNTHGAWITIYGVMPSRYVDNMYYCVGLDEDEYVDNWVEDYDCYDLAKVVEFIDTYYGHDIDGMLDDMRDRIDQTHRIGDIGIVLEEWCEHWELDPDDIEEEKLMEWLGNQIDNHKS